MSRMSNSTAIGSNNVTRPDSSKLAELHVYVVPPDIYRDKFNNVLNTTLDETISVGFIRVPHETKLYTIREEIDQQIGLENIPRDFVFLKNIGRSLTRVKPKQEYQLKVKNFCPPLAAVPEIYLLEVTADLRAILGVSSESPSINSVRNSLLAEDSPRNPLTRSRFPPLNNSYDHFPYDDFDPEDPRQRSMRRRQQRNADRLVEETSRRKRHKTYPYPPYDSWDNKNSLPHIHHDKSDGFPKQSFSQSESSGSVSKSNRSVDLPDIKSNSGVSGSDKGQASGVINDGASSSTPTPSRLQSNPVDRSNGRVDNSGASQSITPTQTHTHRFSESPLQHRARNNLDSPIHTSIQKPTNAEQSKNRRNSLETSEQRSIIPHGPYPTSSQPLAHLPLPSPAPPHSSLNPHTHNAPYQPGTARPHPEHTSANNAHTGEAIEDRDSDPAAYADRYNGHSLNAELNTTAYSTNPGEDHIGTDQSGRGTMEDALSQKKSHFTDGHKNSSDVADRNLATDTQTYLSNGHVLDRRKSGQDENRENGDSSDKQILDTIIGEDDKYGDENTEKGQYENERLKSSQDNTGLPGNVHDRHGHQENSNNYGNDGEIISNELGVHSEADAVTASKDNLYGSMIEPGDREHLSGNIGSGQHREEDQENEAHFDDDSDNLSAVSSEHTRVLTEEDKNKIREEKIALIAELNLAREERRRVERKREETVKKAKMMQTKTQNRRNHTRDIWKKRYFEEKKKTAPLEDQTNRCRVEIEHIHRKLMGFLEAPKEQRQRARHDEPSFRSNLKIQATKLQHDNADLQRRIDTYKMKLTTEMKLRNQAESELRSLRSDLTQKKINLTLTRSQQVASLSTSQDNISFMSQPPTHSPKSQHLIG